MTDQTLLYLKIIIHKKYINYINRIIIVYKSCFPRAKSKIMKKRNEIIASFNYMFLFFINKIFF